jgi:hypothetical protein
MGTEVTNPASVQFVCSICARTVTALKKKERTPPIPPGWKRHQDKLYCGLCWKQRYLLRAVSMPVAAPIDLSWKELRDRLKPLWQETTRACNWMVTELYARDVHRKPEDTTLRPMPKIYLYPAARLLFPALPSQTVSSLERAVGRKYRARRLEVIWRAGKSLPNYRYPTPLPFHNQSWNARLDDGNRPIVSVRLGDGRVELRLKGGPQFRRQLASFRQIVDGEAEPGELAIYSASSLFHPAA